MELWRLKPLTDEQARGRTVLSAPRRKTLRGRGDVTLRCRARGCRGTLAENFGPPYGPFADVVFECPECGKINEFHVWQRTPRLWKQRAKRESGSRK